MVLCNKDNHWSLRRPVTTDGKSVLKSWAESFSNEGVFGSEWKGREIYLRSALRDGNEECRDETEGIADKRSQLVLRVECLASQPQSCIA